MADFNLNDIDFETVETETQKEPENEKGFNELFSHIENEKRNISPPSEKKYMEGEFAARVLFRIINGLFNGAVLWKTGRTSSDMNIRVTDDDKDDFISIVSAGIGTGTVKMPNPLIMFFILVLSIYLEPCFALAFYDSKKSVEKINLGTKTKMGYKGTVEKKKKTGSGRHKATCATNMGGSCDCR